MADTPIVCPQCRTTTPLAGEAQVGATLTCEGCGLTMIVGAIAAPASTKAGAPAPHDEAPSAGGSPSDRQPEPGAASGPEAGAPSASEPGAPGRGRQYRKLPKVREDFEVENAERAAAVLSEWLDVSPALILTAHGQLSSGEAYKTWKIPKPGNGTFRQISSPTDELKTVQRRILDRLLYRIAVSNAAHGFVPGRSIVTGARVHLSTAREILNLDLKDAFPSVATQRVKHLFVRHTKIPLIHLGHRRVEIDELSDVINMLVRLTTHEGGLPQGAPTSGALLNVSCVKLDKYVFRALEGFEQERGQPYRYTRYADDLTISSEGEIGRELNQAIQKVIRNCGFTVNPAKIEHRSRAKNQMLEVTGLYLEKGQIRIPREKLDRYRATIHQAAKLAAGELSDEQRLTVQSLVGFVAMVYGKLPTTIAKPYFEFLEHHGLKKPWEIRRAPFTMYPRP